MKALFLVFIFSCVCGIGLCDDANKADQSKIQGKWVVTSATANGHSLDMKGSYTFTGPKLVIEAEEGKMEFSFKLDDSTKPKRLIAKPKEEPKDAEMCPLAYDFSGELLLIAVGNPGKPPKDISDKNDQTLLTLKRDK